MGKASAWLLYTRVSTGEPDNRQPGSRVCLRWGLVLMRDVSTRAIQGLRNGKKRE
jgi:hypothetical protein